MWGVSVSQQTDRKYTKNVLHDESIQVLIQEYLMKTDDENRTLIQFTIRMK